MEIGEGSIGDPQDIADIIETLRRAGRGTEQGDADAVVGMFDKDPDVVLFDFLAPGVTTVDEVKKNVERLSENADGPIINQYPKVTVQMLSDDIAYSMAYGHVAVKSKDGSEIDVNMRVTDIWRKTDGKWLAIHEHSSLSADLSTGKAVMKQPI